MIILPLESDPKAALYVRPLQTTGNPAALAMPLVTQSILRLVVFGFSPTERKLIQNVAALTQRRSVRLELCAAPADIKTADAVLLDGTNSKIMLWAEQTSQLKDKTVLQIDGTPLPGVTLLNRPMQWLQLPALLQRTLQTKPTADADQPQSAA